MTTNAPSNQSQINRDPRITSHALVDVRKYKHFSFFTESAVLLDLSIAGFKLEFTGEVEAKPGTHYWLSIPLQPLGISSPKRFICKAECKWFDESRFRIGGIFIKLENSEKMILEQVLEVLKNKGMVGG